MIGAKKSLIEEIKEPWTAATGSLPPREITDLKWWWKQNLRQKIIYSPIILKNVYVLIAAIFSLIVILIAGGVSMYAIFDSPKNLQKSGIDKKIVSLYSTFTDAIERNDPPDKLYNDFFYKGSECGQDTYQNLWSYIDNILGRKVTFSYEDSDQEPPRKQGKMYSLKVHGLYVIIDISGPKTVHFQQVIVSDDGENLKFCGWINKSTDGRRGL